MGLEKAKKVAEDFELAPRAPNGGRYTEDEIKLGLTVLARHSGITRRAEAALAAQGLRISRATLHEWKRQRHHELYHEIAREHAPLIEAKVNRLAWENAAAAAETTAKAIEKADAQLEDPKADAANIAYKLSLVQGIQQDKALAIEGRPSHITAHVDLDDILDDLNRLVPGLVIDSTAEDITDATG